MDPDVPWDGNGFVRSFARLDTGVKVLYGLDWKSVACCLYSTAIWVSRGRVAAYGSFFCVCVCVCVCLRLKLSVVLSVTL